jgi:hypothetical protein
MVFISWLRSSEKKYAVSLFLLVFSLSAAFAGGKTERTEQGGRIGSIFTAVTGENADSSPEEGKAAAEALVVPLPPQAAPVQAEPDRSERVMKNLAAAYPDRTGPAEFRNGDWAIQVYGEWFYYAEGRLLPEALRNTVSEYAAQPFYNYLAELPPWEPPAAEMSERMRGMMAQRSGSRAKRSTHFFDALWRASSRSEAWDRVKQIYFLGFTVMVHYSILEELSLVEERIRAISETNAEVAQWIKSINSVDAWNWRNIADSQNRSYHSYGAAIDFLPKSLGGKETYWQWTARIKPEWWAVPYSDRLHPPAEVIKIFESLGFLWGGKWTTYDTMHFEYRPEILIMSGIPQSNF